jgi:hypothetical protein
VSKAALKVMGAGLLLSPADASAHGDHTGLRGVVHTLTEPAHIGVALLALIALGMALRLLRPRRGRDDAA